MPTDVDGNKIPFTPSQKSQIVTYASRLKRIVQSDGTGYSENEVLRKVNERFGLHRDDWLAALQLTRNATRINDAAENFNKNPNVAMVPFVIPTRPGAFDRQGQYQYELLVTARNNRTGETSTYSYSSIRMQPTALSDFSADVNARRGEFAHHQSPPHASGNNRPADTYTYSVHIMSVGVIRGT